MNPTLSIFEPPITQEFCKGRNYWQAFGQLAPGVRGVAFEERGTIFIPMVVADHEGNGDVGKFLDRLSPRCAIICITSKRLEGMLIRRDWRPGIELVDGEYMDVWRRKR